MKISKLFHWLYATLMFLPLLVAPIFGIYSHRHTIDSYSIELPNYVKVNFNQIINIPNTSYSFGGVDIVATDGLITISGTADGTSSYIDFYDNYELLTANHKYIVKPSGSSSAAILADPELVIREESLYTCSEPLMFICRFGLTNGTTYNETVSFECFDLTQMFGSGNEPTLQQFNTLFPNDYYSYTLSELMLIEYGTQIYNDTDIGSQFIYTIYGTLDKYFNFSNVFGLNQLGEYMYLNWFYGNSYIGFSCFFLLLTYWLLISLCWLIFDLLMYVPNLVHRWLDRGAIQ